MNTKIKRKFQNFFTVSDPYDNEYRFSIRSRTCSSSLFSSKFSFNLVVGIDRIDNYNSHALLNLMRYNFEGNNNALKNNEVKF